MAGKVTDVPFGGKGNLGTFRARMFNTFNQDEMAEYCDLRTQAQNRGSGVIIDSIQQYVKETSTSETEGDSHVKSTVKELYMFVQWWEKQVEPRKGDTDADAVEGIREFSTERPARTGG